ncbi:hypothetical protein MRX96_038622 [Rhipicephalus microplus]
MRPQSRPFSRRRVDTAVHIYAIFVLEVSKEKVRVLGRMGRSASHLGASTLWRERWGDDDARRSRRCSVQPQTRRLKRRPESKFISGGVAGRMAARTEALSRRCVYVCNARWGCSFRVYRIAWCLGH